MNDKGVPEIMFAVGDLAHSLGVRNINRLDGCWEHKIDERWTVAVNAHSSDRKTSSGVPVPPFSMYFEFNGWPAGIVNAAGGEIAAGECANEDSLLAAIRGKSDAD